MTDPVLAFNTDHGRYYAHPKTHSQVPSVSNITNMKAKPLFGAGMREAARYASENVARLGALTQEEVYKLVSNPPRRDDSPSVIGDVVHGWVERYVKGEPVNPQDDEVRQAPQTAKWMYQRFLNFANGKYEPKFTDSEFTVWSNRYGYAGTADLSAYVKGKHLLIDLKTGRDVYPDYGLQVAAYAKADVVISADGTEKPMPKYDGYAVLHLRPRSYCLNPIDNIEHAFTCFLHLKAVFDWEVEYAHKTIVASPKIN